MFSRGFIVFALVLTVCNAQILNFCDQNNILDLIDGVTQGLLGINILPATGLLAGVVQLLLGTTVTTVSCVTQLGGSTLSLGSGILSGLEGQLAIGCIGQDVEKAQQLCEADVLKKVISSQGCVTGGLTSLVPVGGGLLSGVLGGGLLGGLLGGGGGIPLVGNLLGGGLLSGLGGLLGSNGCVKDANTIARAQCLLAAGQQHCQQIAQLSSNKSCDLCSLLSIVRAAPNIADCACNAIPNYGAGGNLLGLLGGSNPLCIVENVKETVIEDLLGDLLGIVLSLLGGVAHLPILGQCPV